MRKATHKKGEANRTMSRVERYDRTERAKRASSTEANKGDSDEDFDFADVFTHEYASLPLTSTPLLSRDLADISSDSSFGCEQATAEDREKQKAMAGVKGLDFAFARYEGATSGIRKPGCSSSRPVTQADLAWVERQSGPGCCAYCGSYTMANKDNEKIGPVTATELDADIDAKVEDKLAAGIEDAPRLGLFARFIRFLRRFSDFEHHFHFSIPINN